LEDCKRIEPKAQNAAPPAQEDLGLPDDIADLANDEATPDTAAPPQDEAAIELLSASPGGLPNVVRLKVLEAERQAVRQIDSIYIGVPLSLAQRLVFGPDERAASAIIIQLNQTDMMPAAKTRLRTLIKDFDQELEVLTFQQISPVYGQILANYASIFQFIAILMAVITLFSIVNAINMAIGERVGEIGTLRALGFQRSIIRRIFIYEGAILGILGSIVGALTAVGLALVINASALSWTPPGRSTPIPLRVDIFAAPSLILYTVLGLSLVACLSALWPSNSAAKMEVTEALRHT
ncbi:MAG: FtsX-like permease family protein, partial [Myxococcota bacterium]